MRSLLLDTFLNNGERVLKRILIDGGYYDAVKKKYFYYLTDHLGNNRVVAEANGTVVQKTHYYPFGMAFAEETAKDEGQKEQPYKYNGKELDRRLQLNTYDYEARYMDPAIGRFTSIDPLAEKFYSWSPYVYVYNNPLKFIDPDGKRGRPARNGRDLTRNYNLIRYGRGNPRFATAYRDGIRPPSTEITRSYGIPGSNLRRQPLPESPLENVTTVGGNTVQMSRNNELGKGVTASIETLDHSIQVIEVFKQLYTENGPKAEKSYSLEFANPLQKALFEGKQEAYNQSYSSREAELKQEGKLSSSEITSQVISEIGYSPHTKAIISFMTNRSKMDLVKEEYKVIPEIRQD